MTTPARPVRSDIPALHADIAPSGALQRERRALYQFATELLPGGRPQILDPDVIDSPLARNHIGDVLAGRASLTYSALVGTGAVADAASRVHNLWVASRPEANTLLAAALDTVGSELSRQEAGFESPRLLTETDGERFISALRVLSDGVALARSVNPELIDDLLVHVALVGVLDPQCAGRLASASLRTFPGLVLLKSSQSSIEVAEALVHEGAHQKLFDLAITHDLLNADSHQCPPFHPPWGPKESLWPLEQTLAACHAYACMARFDLDAGVMAGIRVVGHNSLLPVASERSELLGQWLLDKGDHLGDDAHILLNGLLGRWPRTSRITEVLPRQVTADYVINRQLEFRRCGSSNRVLVGCPSQPPQLCWVSDEAATVIELLAQSSLEEVTKTFAQQWRVNQSDAAGRLSAVLSDLCVAGLLSSRGTKSRDSVGGGRNAGCC
jgi:hypothetical protein